MRISRKLLFIQGIMIISAAAGIFSAVGAIRFASAQTAQAIQLREGSYHLNRLHSVYTALQRHTGTMGTYSSAWSKSYSALDSMSDLDFPWQPALSVAEQMHTAITAGRMDQLPSSADVLTDTADRLAAQSSERATTALARLNLALPAAVLIGLSGLLLYGILLTRFLHGIRYKFARLMEELHGCSNSGNPIMLPAGNPDELDTLLFRVRNLLHDYRARLQTYRTCTHDSIELHSQVRNQIRSFQSTTANLSAMHTSLRGRIESFSQMLSNTKETLGVLQLKTGRMREQGENQAVQVTETTSAIEQIDASINSIAERAEVRRTQSIELRDRARSDEEGIRQTRSTIDLIANSMTGIEEILQTIHAISEQTSLLSLNAFIESAHGTESNKGFEVVASEIRSLADSTADNAGSIHNLLNSIDDRVREARFFSEKTQHSFTKSVEVIDAFADSMQSIAEGMHFSADISRKVVEAAHPLSQRADQIKELSTHVDQSTEESRSTLSSAGHNSDQLYHSLQSADSSLQAVEQWINDTHSTLRLSETLLNRLSRQLDEPNDTSQMDSPN